MKPNIITIVADCLRYDRVMDTANDNFSLDTKNIDRLADQGVSYSNSYSTGSWTVPAHGSFFSGRYPSEHAATCLNKRFDIEREGTLAGQLSSLDYTSVGFSANPWVSDEFGFSSGFDRFYDIHPGLFAMKCEISARNNSEYQTSIFPSVEDGIKRFVRGIMPNRIFNYLKPKHPSASAEDVNSRIFEEIDIGSQDRPFYMFVNYMDVHEPYRIHEKYLHEEEFGVQGSISWNLDSLNQNEIDDYQSEAIESIYNASVTYLDSCIGELLKWLESRNVLEESIIIILSDHGQSLGENGFWGHGTYLSDELIRIPVIVSGPSQYIDRWPDRDTTISIGEVPYYLLESISEQFQSGSDLLKRSANKKIAGGDSPVAAESHGAHEEGYSDLDSIPNKGFISIALNDTKYVKNLDDCSIKSLIDDFEWTYDKIPPEMRHLEDEILEIDVSMNDEPNQAGMNADTQKRLKDLGYI
ncbi:sulfatase [Salinigranum marinum]|uniref:sulfatase n=1 Tax=Salinigranum marinum TaxID=1515595 RepID=UPI002989D22C|nr:sulfatase [Salinigranum marinum]